jgi:hypothetical protein
MSAVEPVTWNGTSMGLAVYLRSQGQPVLNVNRTEPSPNREPGSFLIRYTPNIGARAALVDCLAQLCVQRACTFEAPGLIRFRDPAAAGNGQRPLRRFPRRAKEN